MGKYGTNLEGFGAFEGGVNADKGAPLVSTNSDGETALLFGPAALREIQAGVANGDFAIPPDAAGDTITAENPLPYWTFTDDDSAGAITCKVVTADAGNSIIWTVTAGTTTGKTATLSRYVAVPSSTDKAYAFYPEFYVTSGGSATSRNAIFTLQFYTSDFVASGTAITRTYPFSDFASGAAAVFLLSDTSSRLQVPANARFAKISIQVDTTGTNASESTLTLSEVKMLTAYPMLLAADRKDAGASGPGAIWKTNGSLYISADIPTTWTSGTLSSTQPRISLSNSVVSLTASTFSGQITGLAGADITGSTVVAGDLTTTGEITGDGVTTDLKHGITLQRTTNLTINTSLDASATAITWSSAVKNTSLYAYWSSGSTIAIPLDGWYSITCHLISGTGLGTGFAFRLYALVNGTVIAETETQAGANTTSDTFSISTIAYMTAADSLVFRASASSASKTIGGSRRSACSVVYLGNTSA